MIMKRTGIFILLVSTVVAALGQGEVTATTQGNNIRQYQRLQQQHGQGLQKGAKAGNHSVAVQAIKLNSAERSKASGASSVPPQRVAMKPSAKLTAGKSISPVNHPAQGQMAKGRTQLVKPTGAAKPAERLTAMKMTGQNIHGLQSGAKISRSASSTQPVEKK